MIFRVPMDATSQRRSFIRMTTLALDLDWLVRMRVALDGCVASVASLAAVHAVAKRLAIDGNAVTVGVLHGLVAVACQAIRLRVQPARNRDQEKNGNRSANPAACQGLPHAS